MSLTFGLTMLSSFYTIIVAASMLVASCFTGTNTTAVSQANVESSPVSNAFPTPQPTFAKVARQVKFSSAYTKLSPDVCKPIADGDETEETPEICRGYEDYNVYVSYHGTATRIYIGREINADLDSWKTSDFPSFIANQAGNGQVIEWRLADGVPFACIVRAEMDKSLIEPGQKGRINELVIKNLKGYEPINVTINAIKNRESNADAQKAADTRFKQL